MILECTVISKNDLEKAGELLSEAITSLIESGGIKIKEVKHEQRNSNFQEQ